MFENPFTPIFGGKPEHFFGRKAILSRFDSALIDRGSEDRALFVTGTRGCGKTALIEQLSRRAKAMGMKTIDVGADDTVHLLMRGLQAHEKESRGVNPQAGINVLGTGGSLGGVSSAKVTHFDRSDLQLVFLKACDEHGGGLFISIDEVQKVPEADLSAISGAFQMASRKGHNVMLALAGLPYSHDDIIQYAGCTYLRRAAHEELGLFSPAEVRDAFTESFAQVKGLDLEDDALDALIRASYGHPYVIQLLGYHTVALINARHDGTRHVITASEAADALPLAIGAYERRALAPLIDELSPRELLFLRGMSSVLDDDRVARIADMERFLDKRQTSLSAARDSLLKIGVIIAVDRGALMFNIPYLASYVQKAPSSDANKDLVRQWRL